MAKFETTGSMSSACTNEECTTIDLTILPNKTAVREQTVSSFFYASRSMQNSINAKKYGFDGFGTGTMDVHMMKNTEWGCVAYLSQSKYGKYGNPMYIGANKEIYQNKSEAYITGNSNGTPSTNIYNTQVTYDVPDSGYGASTTGTIYGVYDMSGGSYEYVMGNYNNSLDSSGFTIFPETKYYDLYVSDNMSIGYQAGDATYEVFQWYRDDYYFLGSTHSWLGRGGWHGSANEYSTTSGAFAIGSAPGEGYVYNGMRLIIKP